MWSVNIMMILVVTQSQFYCHIILGKLHDTVKGRVYLAETQQRSQMDVELTWQWGDDRLIMWLVHIMMIFMITQSQIYCHIILGIVAYYRQRQGVFVGWNTAVLTNGCWADLTVRWWQTDNVVSTHHDDIYHHSESILLSHPTWLLHRTIGHHLFGTAEYHVNGNVWMSPMNGAVLGMITPLSSPAVKHLPPVA